MTNFLQDFLSKTTHSFEPSLNYLSNDITSKFKLSNNDTSLFSVDLGIDTFASNLNYDLEKISEWTFWKKI